MTATIIESPGLIQQNTKIPGDHLEVCRRQGIKTEGNAAGNTVDVLDLTGANTRPERDPKGALVDGYGGSRAGRARVGGRYGLGV